MAPVKLPYAHCETKLRALAGQAEGFGRLATGGRDGPLYHVTNLNDDGPGSLREACRWQGPFWIVFDVTGTIHLKSILSVSSYKTIDGRGQWIRITGNGFRLNSCEHVIICNILFEEGRGHDVDAIQIKPNSKHIWIDRCTLKDYSDGLIDVTRGSTDVTISRCALANHNKTMLIGSDPTHCEDRNIRVTIHHCYFDACRQRLPRVRFAKVHLYNNYTRNWALYAVGASVESQIYSQCNIYEAWECKVAFKYITEKAGDKSQACCGCIYSEGDLFLPGTKSGLQPGNMSFHPRQHYQTCTIEPATTELKNAVQYGAGWQHIPRPADW